VDELQKLVEMKTNLQSENLAAMRDLDARQNQLTRELDDLAAKRAAWERKISVRRHAMRKLNHSFQDMRSMPSTSKTATGA
jgi:predicted  nucleic acid-binding Zn-ribbon protein